MGVRANGREVALWSATVGRVVLGGVFVVAGALKIPDPAEAVRAVRAYRLLPEVLVAPVAFGMPVVEIAVGLALLAGVFVRTAAVADVDVREVWTTTTTITATTSTTAATTPPITVRRRFSAAAVRSRPARPPTAPRSSAIPPCS